MQMLIEAKMVATKTPQLPPLAWCTVIWTVISTPPSSPPVASPPPERQCAELCHTALTIRQASSLPTFDARSAWSDDGRGVNQSTLATSACASPSCPFHESSLYALHSPLHLSLDVHSAPGGDGALLEDGMAPSWETSSSVAVAAADARQQREVLEPSSGGESVEDRPLVAKEYFAADSLTIEADMGAEDAIKSLVNLAACRGLSRLLLKYVKIKSQDDVRR